MNELYPILNVFKQSHWWHEKHRTDTGQSKVLLINNIMQLRQMHPQMGAKKMYHLLQPDFIGRDGFITLYNQAGFGLVKQRSFRRTTFSTPSAKYSNLTVNKIFTDINQLWSSDITYLPIGKEQFLYLTFIIDVYSRRILGYHVSENLMAQANVKALEMALNVRNIELYDTLIHHSDKGTQYTSTAYTRLLEQHSIKISMCNSVYENTHIERVNGIIKNEYLQHQAIKNIAECQRTLKKAVILYNQHRPHWSLDGLTPESFEKKLGTIPLSERIHLQIYHDTSNTNCQNVSQIALNF